MSSRNAKLYLQDILNFTKGMESAADLQGDHRTFLAVIHSLQIIGEAARQMPKSFREAHSDFPWRETASLRNVIAHDLGWTLILFGMLSALEFLC
jgi:uncharacterized protein with HEPN domain